MKFEKQLQNSWIKFEENILLNKIWAKQKYWSNFEQKKEFLNFCSIVFQISLIYFYKLRLNFIQIVYKFCSAILLFWFCVTKFFVQILFNSYLNFTHFFLSFVQTSFKFCTNFIQILFKCFSSGVKTLSKFCAYFVKSKNSLEFCSSFVKLNILNQFLLKFSPISVPILFLFFCYFVKVLFNFFQLVFD